MQCAFVRLCEFGEAVYIRERLSVAFDRNPGLSPSPQVYLQDQGPGEDDSDGDEQEAEAASRAPRSLLSATLVAPVYLLADRLSGQAGSSRR